MLFLRERPVRDCISGLTDCTRKMQFLLLCFLYCLYFSGFLQTKHHMTSFAALFVFHRFDTENYIDVLVQYYMLHLIVVALIYKFLQPCTLKGKADQWKQNAQTQLTTLQSICSYQKTRMILSQKAKRQQNSVQNLYLKREKKKRQQRLLGLFLVNIGCKKHDQFSVKRNYLPLTVEGIVMHLEIIEFLLLLVFSQKLLRKVKLKNK